MTAVIALLGGVRATVFAALALLLLVVSGVQTWRAGHHQERAELWQAASQSCHGAVVANVQTIAELRAANQQFAEQARATEKKAAEAVETVARERDALAAELDRRRRDRGQIYEQDQDAAVWGRQRVPARIVEQLRE